MTNAIQRLYQAGQSIWCDNLSRSMIESADRNHPATSLRAMIDAGVVGITSNPTIFMKSITSGGEYQSRLERLAARGLDPYGVYEGLVLPDIADAADLLRPVFDRTRGVDGFVSLEVNPRLAHDTEGTVAEARRLFAALNRPNVFIKVPATREGIPAVRTLIAEGINVNITLIFGLDVYEMVIRAYLEGLERFAGRGGDVGRVASVASFFVSRVDTLVDKLLAEHAAKGGEATAHQGRAAVANARLAYALFERSFGPSSSFAAMAQRGARVQRPLWASTSTKNPKYPDTLYVDSLVGPHTVNTLPPETLVAVLDHGRADVTLRDDLPAARAVFDRLAALGVNMKSVCDQLTAEGVKSFVQSFDQLLANIAEKSRTEFVPAN